MHRLFYTFRFTNGCIGTLHAFEIYPHKPRTAFFNKNTLYSITEAKPYLDNLYTIEVAMKDIAVRIRNSIDPVLFTKTLRLLQKPRSPQ